MKRIITSFESCDSQVIAALSKEFPRGISEDHFESFTIPTKGTIKAIEIIIDDVMYLVKMTSADFVQRYFSEEEDS